MIDRPGGGFYGVCGGGPFHGRMLHHGLKTIDIAMSNNKVVSFVRVADPPPGMTYGRYLFDEPSLAWVWEPPPQPPEKAPK